MGNVRAKDWPRLSKTLDGPRDLDRCQACGGNATATWQECDEADQPELVYVRLCRSCSDKLIEPHPRLYRRIGDGSPAAGAMPCCRGCTHAVQLSCRSPLLKGNGGPGLAINVKQRGFCCSRGKGGGCRPIYDGEPECAGREAVKPAEAEGTGVPSSPE